MLILYYFKGTVHLKLRNSKLNSEKGIIENKKDQKKLEE